MNDESQEKSKTKKPSSKKSDPFPNEVILDIFSKFSCPANSYFRFKIANFILKNGLPLSLSEDLGLLVNSLAQKLSNENLVTFHTSRYYTTKFCNSICESLQLAYFKKLANEHYSLAIDVGTSEGNEEYLAVTARYFDSAEAVTTTTTLLGLLPLKGSTTGENKFNVLTNFLFAGKEGVLRKSKLVGVSTDGAPNMISKNFAGVTNKLLVEAPNIVVTHDLCHVFNLVNKKCINSFPKKYQDIISNICSTFAASPKKCAKLREIIKENSDKLLAIKHYTPIRWKSFFECLGRIIDLNEPLQKFYNPKNNPDTEQATEKIPPKTNSQMNLSDAKEDGKENDDVVPKSKEGNYQKPPQDENSDDKKMEISYEKYQEAPKENDALQTEEEKNLKNVLRRSQRLIQDKKSDDKKMEIINEKAQEAPKNIQKTDYFAPENLLMLRLLHNLLKKHTTPMTLLETDNLDIVSVTETVKSTLMIISEYLFNIANDDFNHLEPLLTAANDSIIYQAKKRSLEEFQVIFIKKHSQFKEDLELMNSNSGASVKTEFFKNAYDFFVTAFEHMKKKLPPPDSALMQVDAILLQRSNDVDKIRTLALKFPHIISKDQLVEFNLELELIEGQKSQLALAFATLITKNFSLFAVWRHFSTKYPLTYQLIRALEVLPYSTASVERTFSHMNDIKTSKRNRLGLSLNLNLT